MSINNYEKSFIIQTSTDYDLKIDVVTTIYNQSECIDEFYHLLESALTDRNNKSKE